MFLCDYAFAAGKIEEHPHVDFLIEEHSHVDLLDEQHGEHIDCLPLLPSKYQVCAMMQSEREIC